MAKQLTKKTAAKKAATKKTATKKALARKSAANKVGGIINPVVEREKNLFEKNFGEGTAFDLDYGKLLIIALCIYIAVKVS